MRHHVVRITCAPYSTIYPRTITAMPPSRPKIRAQSGERVMLSLFLATPSLMRLAAVKGTNDASVVQLRIMGRRLSLLGQRSATMKSYKRLCGDDCRYSMIFSGTRSRTNKPLLNDRHIVTDRAIKQSNGLWTLASPHVLVHHRHDENALRAAA